MRVLLPDLSQAPEPGLYRRFVQHAQIRGMVADHLFRGEPYLAMNAAVLTAAEAGLLARLTEAFARAFVRAGEALRTSTPGLIGLGFPWVAAELLAAEELRAPILGRFDFVRDVDGRWWLLEFNADTPSGVREATVVDALVARLLPAARGLGRPNEALAPALERAFGRAVAGLPRGSALGLLTDASALEDLAQMAFTGRLLRPALGRLGVPIVLGDVDNVAGGPRGLSLRGQRVGALYRYYPFEAMVSHPAFPAIFEAVCAGRVRLLNGLFGLLLQHKALMSWLWEHRGDLALPSDEADAVRDHVPPTWPASAVPPSSPEDVVVKQVFGREGEEVYLGEHLTAEDWGSIGRQGTYVVQRRIRVQGYDAALPSIKGPFQGHGYPVVGSYVVDGRWAGFYTRFGGPVTTAQAKFFATLVERGTH